MMDIAYLCLGLIGLWAGTEMTVTSAVRIAEHYRWSHVFVGLTLLAFGTDLPELVVAISGALNNLHGIESSGVLLGNAVGSSVSQISVVAGLVALCHPLTLARVRVRDLGVPLVAATVILFVVGLGGVVTRMEGVVLLLAFGAYLAHLIGKERRTPVLVPDEAPAGPPEKVGRAIVIIVAGLGVVIFSAELAVEKALSISEAWGVRQSFVGAIIIGLGTSLPELAISLSAVLKGKGGLSLGNLVGSNIFDCLVPVGVAAVIAPVLTDRVTMFFDLPYLLLVTGVFLVMLKTASGLRRREGTLLMILYLVYVVVKVKAA